MWSHIKNASKIKLWNRSLWKSHDDFSYAYEKHVRGGCATFYDHRCWCMFISGVVPTWEYRRDRCEPSRCMGVFFLSCVSLRAFVWLQCLCRLFICNIVHARCRLYKNTYGHFCHCVGVCSVLKSGLTVHRQDRTGCDGGTRMRMKQTEPTNVARWCFFLHTAHVLLTMLDGLYFQRGIKGSTHFMFTANRVKLHKIWYSKSKVKKQFWIGSIDWFNTLACWANLILKSVDGSGGCEQRYIFLSDYPYVVMSCYDVVFEMELD